MQPFANALECTTAAEWEHWLGQHHGSATEVWLKIAKKGAAEPSVTISEALDAALCYGWIDSHRKGGDATSYWQRYSPRRARSPWSRINVDRAEALVAAGRMTPAGWKEIEAAQSDGRWQRAYEAQQGHQIPADLEAALAQHPAAREAFDALTKTARYGIALPLLKARTPEIRQTRLRKALDSLLKR